VKVIRDDDAGARSERESVVAIGVFDGLHLGHQRVIEQITSLVGRDGALATVVTFDPHPAQVLAPASAPLLIATMDQRLEGLATLGVDQVRVVTFNHVLAAESATSFIERVLVGELRTRDVVVGEDFRFGHDRKGDVAMLQHVGSSHGFTTHPAPIYGAGSRWSSSAIRLALASGELHDANDILGRPFTLRGTVEHGDARGAGLGYPTANVLTAPGQQLPAIGIYAGAARDGDGRWWPAAISVGTRPQFYDDGPLLVEAHLVGLEGDLYDSVVDVAFVARLRSEMTFAGTDELVAQIDRDVVQTLEIYDSFTPESSALLR